jgi:hypothetical protein
LSSIPPDSLTTIGLRLGPGRVIGPPEQFEVVLVGTLLAAVNLQHRNRYPYGPSWRADIVTAIESGLDSPAAIARRVGCSYEPAHRVPREWRVATAA